MNPEERAALERLLEYVGRGFCAVQEECRMLRKYLKTLPVVARMKDTVDSGRTLVSSGSGIGDDVVFVLSNARGGIMRLRELTAKTPRRASNTTTKKPIIKKRKH